jgi:hypothetical protein
MSKKIGNDEEQDESADENSNEEEQSLTEQV